MPPKKKSVKKKPAKKPTTRKPRSRSISQRQRVTVTVKQMVGAQEPSVPPGAVEPFAKGWSTFSPITYQMPPPPMLPRAAERATGPVPISGGPAIGGFVEGHTLGGSAERSRLVRGEASTQTGTTRPVMVDAGTTQDVMLLDRDSVRRELTARGISTAGLNVDQLRELLKDARA